MKKKFTFEYTEQELLQLFKQAFKEILLEQNITQASAHSPPKTDIEILTPKQVCEILHISRPTLIEYSKKNLLRGKRNGGKIFYKRSAIEAFLTIKHNNREGA